MSNKPTPLKVFGRSHYACTRCKSSKIKCSGERPACANCKQVGKGSQCHYPARDRKIVIMESELNRLNARVLDLEKRQSSELLSDFKSKAPMHIKTELSVLGLDSYLFPDEANKTIPPKLLALCASSLPDKPYTTNLMELVCLTYSSEFYLVDREDYEAVLEEIYLYFAQLTSPNDSQPEVSPITPAKMCFFFATLAYGEQICNCSSNVALSACENDSSRHIPGIEYYTLAASLFQLDYEQPNIQFIQSSLLLGFYSCNLNRYNTVYNYFGVALRSAVACGFHRRLEVPQYGSIEEQKSRQVYSEKTKRLWWTTFAVDIFWAARMNMPVHIDYTDTDVALPTESPSTDLNDMFDAEILECNVHLVKFLSKFNKLIYGSNMRSFSVNYINTDLFNQRLLVKNILRSLDEFVTQFEDVVLSPYKEQSIIKSRNRNLANLFLRFDQLIIFIVAPLVSLIFDSNSASNIENNWAVLKAISTGIKAASRSVLTFMKLYEYNKLFVLGFWDSHHLFSALMILALAAVAGYRSEEYNAGIALLNYMAERGSVNAKNYLKKAKIVHDFLAEMKEIPVSLPLSSRISDFALQRDIQLNTEIHNEFFNPFMAQTDASKDEILIGAKSSMEGSLYEQLGFGKLSLQTKEKLSDMAKSIQSWDNYSGLPIHISGTIRRPAANRAAQISRQSN